MANKAGEMQGKKHVRGLRTRPPLSVRQRRQLTFLDELRKSTPVADWPTIEGEKAKKKQAGHPTSERASRTYLNLCCLRFDGMRDAVQKWRVMLANGSPTCGNLQHEHLRKCRKRSEI